MDGKFEPFDPEAADFELDLDDPGRSHAFASVRRQYQRGLDALNSRPADCLPAIREPVKALEALCRTLTNKPKASLGEAVDHLLGGALHRRALSAVLESIGGYSSTVQGAPRVTGSTRQWKFDILRLR